ncbi:suppressor of glycerol defect [Orbilia ellipsospora]|uniref:Suppressor of glycerol defect n=1 Tax=Orbilia ellipsospora TaxID=2528407 RepID=A0AAV9X793_9PEZI
MRVKPKLPKSLLDQIEEKGDKNSGSKQSLRNTTARNRKDRRKQERLQKKQVRRDTSTFKRSSNYNGESDSSNEEPEVIHHGQKTTIEVRKPERLANGHARPEPASDTEPKQKANHPKQQMRRAVADKLEEDDAEIAALEKKLNIKGKKLPEGFKEDNLDWLLEGLDSEEEEREQDRQHLAEKRGTKRKREDPSVTRSKNESESDDRFSEGDEESAESENSEDDIFDYSDESDSGDRSVSASDVDMEDAGDDWSGFASEEEEALSKVPVKISKPDPTKPALPANQPAKYMPPAQRRKLGEVPTDNELRKKMQGQVNRLTEQSMLQIVKAVEEFYRDHPRQSVTSTLTSLVLASISNEVNTRETFFTLYGGFVAALYKILGTDFGAYFVQSLVEDFDRCYEEALKTNEEPGSISASKKQTNDFVSLLAELYNFGVIGSSLIFDLIRIFVSEVAELNAELLLRIVRSSGPQLRQDDPSALKDIVSMLNSSVAKAGTEKLSTRFKFMVETLTNLRNNKARKANDSSVVASEAIIRMKKTLGTLNNRSLRASEPLRPSLKDIRDVDKKGKWWLVGASWRNNMVDDSDAKADESEEQPLSVPRELEDDITNYLQLAREQRMNTDIRRAIFVAIMSAEDYTDAREKLFKLRLKRNQEREIPHVLLHCCGNETQYNPYYTLIAQQLCSAHSLRMTFQFSLWEIFRKMGEEDDMNRGDSNLLDEDEEKMPLRKIVNLAKVYGYLVAHGSLSLMILKTLQFLSLQPATKNFLEIFFITVFSETRQRYAKSSRKQESRIRELFQGVSENPSLARGLEYFLEKHVATSDIINGKKEREAVRQGCNVAEDVLKMVILEGTDDV